MLTDRLGAKNIIAMAAAAGIDTMQATEDGRIKTIDLRTADPSGIVPKYFGSGTGIGQYPVSVLDHANGMATFAAGGLRSTAHFVASIVAHGKEVYREPTATNAIGLDAAQAANLTWALAQQPAGRLADGRRTAAVTGVWQLGPQPGVFAHAWIAGYTPRYAMAVWVGNKADERPLKDARGGAVTGETIPAQIYRTVLGAAFQGTPVTQPTEPPPFGDPDAGNAS
jgi:membrane peptidoglycan carboxypeptidase